MREVCLGDPWKIFPLPRGPAGDEMMRSRASAWQPALTKIKWFLYGMRGLLEEIDEKADRIMTKQEDFDKKMERLDAAIAGIRQDVDDLKAQGVDVSALDEKLTKLEDLDAENPGTANP